MHRVAVLVLVCLAMVSNVSTAPTGNIAHWNGNRHHRVNLSPLRFRDFGVYAHRQPAQYPCKIRTAMSQGFVC